MPRCPPSAGRRSEPSPTPLARAGIALVDAPISGGPAGARAGTLAMMAAGPRGGLAALRPCAGAHRPQVFVLGDTPGQAQVMKLVNNLLFAANIVTAFEAFAMGAKAGLDPDVMLRHGQCRHRPQLRQNEVMQEVLSRPLRLRRQRCRSWTRTCASASRRRHALGVPMWAMEQAARVWRFAALQGAGADDLTALARFVEGWAGTEVRRRE